MMNPKSFVDLYDDGLQAEKIENEKKKNTRSAGGKNQPTGGTQQENTSRAIEVQAVQHTRIFSNFNQPLLKVLKRLVQKGLLRPIINVKPLSSNSPGYDPNSYCNFHQAIGHPTDTCISLKQEIQNLIDSGKITDPENPSTRNNLFTNYQNVPPPATMIINSGVSEEDVLNSFENISLQTNENAPNASKQSQKGVEDLLGQPSSKFDYKVFYTKPPSFGIPIELIMPARWGEEFNDEDSPNEKAVESLTPEQPQQGVEDLSGQHLSKFDDEKQLDKKETCTVGV